MNGKKIEALLRRSAADEQTIEKLIRLGGQRAEIDPELAERVREQVYQVWLRKQMQDTASHEGGAREQRFFRRTNRRAWWGFAGFVAGMLLVGVMLTSLPQFFYGQGETVAIVSALQGGATFDGVPLVLESSITSGEKLSTGKRGAVALALANGSLVNIDQLTKVRFIGREDIELIAGAVYFDSRGKGNIRIHTVHGVARDIGTRFETRLSENELLVRVRDGEVRVDQAQTAVYVASGQALQLTDGAAHITEIAADDEQWIWADAMDENFSLTNRSMAEILAWLSRKEGWTLRYQHDTDQQRARQDIIHGRLSAGGSTDVLRQLSLISDMRFTLENKTVVVNYPQ